MLISLNQSRIMRDV